MQITIAPTFGVLPSLLVEDRDDVWQVLLGQPEVGPKDGSCVRPVVFREGANAPTKLNVWYSAGALFDVDGAVVPDFPEIHQALEGHRFIAWTTYNSRATRRRLRVLVPFARTLPAWDHKKAWRAVCGLLGGIADQSQDNVDRLGYLPRIDPSDEAASRAGYAWHIGQGPRLDPMVRFGDGESLTLDDEDEAWGFSDYEAVDEVSEPDKSDWVEQAEAVQKARVYFQNVGPGIQPGGRHAELFKIGCKLWWDFWLDRHEVHQILHEINQRFPEPKQPSEVHAEVEASFVRTRGRAAVRQFDPQGQPKAAGCARLRPPSLTKSELRELAKREKRATDVERRQIGAWLSNLVPARGAATAMPIADPSERDVAVRRCARFLGQQFPSHAPVSLAELFADSIVMSSAREPWSMTQVEVQRLITLSQNERRQSQERERERAANERSEKISIATAGQRDQPYSESEIQAFADDFGCPKSQWVNRWIVALGTAHYIFVNGRYKPPVEISNFRNAAEIDLSAVPGIDIHKLDREGNVTLRSREELISRYGTVARAGILDMTAQRSFYDADRSTFVEAPCPLRSDIEPERVPMVEDWLATFGDTRVLLWLAFATLLDEPLPLLYLVGQRNSGKTLFAHALNRLYRRDRSLNDMQALFQSFNEAVLGSPFLVADEVLPQELLKSSGSERFRQMIVSQSRSVNRKHLRALDMTGYFRFLLLANNSRMLPKGSGFMTEADSAAVAERIVFVNLEDGPARFLARLTRTDKDSFVAKDLLAKHVLWLRDNRPHRNNLRFAVAGQTSEVTRRLDYSGFRGKMLRWIFNALTGSGPLGQLDLDVPIFRNERDNTLHVGVNVSYCQNKWGDVLGASETLRPLATEDLTDVMSTMKLTKEGRRVRLNGKQRRYQVIDSKHVMDWAVWVGVDFEEFEEALRERAERDSAQTFTPDLAPQLEVLEGGAA